jgi:hypothetical protein
LLPAVAAILLALKRRITMLSKPAMTVCLASIIGLGLALSASPSAEASPRFTVANKTNKSLSVDIFNGDDSVCMEASKNKQLSAGETDTYGCAGNGKGRCKIEILKGGDRICKSLSDTCNTAIKMKDDSILYIYKTSSGYDCQFQ